MKLLFAVVLITFPPFATQAQSLIPNAGSILQQIRPQALPERAIVPNVAVEKLVNIENNLPDGAAFLVKKIEITGNRNISTDTLHALVEDSEGKMLTLIQLDKVISRITNYYNSNGYPIARAIIPAQTIKDGVVNVQIIVARYGKISISNNSRVNIRLLNDMLTSIESGQEIQQSSLDHALVMISELPGIMSSSIISPGFIVGTSDMEVKFENKERISGSVVLDNYGNYSTGLVQIGGKFNFIDPLNLRSSDVLSLNVMNSWASENGGIKYGRISYESVINGIGTRLGSAYSSLGYDINGSSNTNGSAIIKSLWLKQPVIRQRDVYLTANIQYDELKLTENISANNRNVKTFLASIDGYFGDAIFAGGNNSWSLSLTSGSVANEANVNNGSDSFTKGNVSFSSLQSLGSKNALYIAFGGQWANSNLDASQKLTVGGPNSVRSYTAGTVSGDQGYSLSAEYRHDLDSLWNGQLQAVAFVDGAHVTQQKDPGINTATNEVSLSSIGLGINWTGPQQWNAKSYLASPLKATPAQLGDVNSLKAWFEVSRGF